MEKKTGLSKQLKKKMPPKPERASDLARGPRLPTHAGLPPVIYTDLHSIPSPSRLFGTGRADLEGQINNLIRKRDRIQSAFDSATEMAGKFQTNSKNYTDLLKILDTLSSCLTDVCQSITKFEAILASQVASESLAYRLQMEEVHSHLNFVGRLDLPRPPHGDQRPPSRRGLSLRSLNVPSPVRPNSSRQPQQLPDVVAGPSRPLVQSTVTQLWGDTPGSLNTAMLHTPETEVEYRRCTHARLHRLDLSADKNVRRQLRMACKAKCGYSTADRLTLWAPAPEVPPKAVESHVVALPDVVVANQPAISQDVAISQVQSKPNEQQALDQAENSNDTVELNSSSTVAVSSSPTTAPTVSLPSSPTSDLIQIDGLHVEQILDLPSPVSEECPSSLWSLPKSTPRPRSPYYTCDTCKARERTPIACDGRITPCECSQYQLEGICWCGTDGSYVDCRNYAPSTPTSLIRKLNAESFHQVAALKAAAKSDALSAIKRKLISTSSSSSESDLE